MWNPLWTLAFTAPLGILDYGAAQFLWFVLQMMVIFVGARILWQSYGGALHNSWWSLITALTIAPTYFVLLLGQIGGLILLGLILFLHSVQRRAWWTAGLSLTLVSLKPHLSYLFWLAIVLWALRERRWRFVGGWVVGKFVMVPFLYYLIPQSTLNTGISSKVEMLFAHSTGRRQVWAQRWENCC